MYITNDLFGCSPTPSSTHNFGTMTETQHAAGLGKRKRQMDTEEGPNYNDNSTAFPQLSPASSRRKLHHSTSDLSARPHRLSPSAHLHARPDARPLKQLKRHSPRVSLIKVPSHLMDMDIPPEIHGSGLGPIMKSPATHSDLRACHICHSAPKRKKDLENYLQCRSCDERACFICARECSAGCQKQLCSKCCVEVGEEGDTYCLGCYQRNVNTT